MNPRMLRLLFWESTIQCNLTCAHCRRLETNETSTRDLTTDQAKNMIEQLYAQGKSQPMMPILVFSGGEPLCREDLFELVQFSHSLGITSALATNGTLIDAVRAREIAKSDIARVSVSLDGANAQTHDRMRQLDGSFDQAVAGIRHLHELNVPFQINMTVTQQNCEQLSDICAMAQSLGAVAVHPFMLVPVGCGVELAETDMMTPLQYEKALLQITELEKQYDMDIKVTCGPHYERVRRQVGLHHNRSQCPGRTSSKSSRGCLAGLGILFVGHQGDVFPCGYLPILCGNILTASLTDIWQKSEHLARLGNSELLEGKCGICSYNRVCGGCRARAYAQTKNYMADEPFCVYEPSGKKG